MQLKNLPKSLRQLALIAIAFLGFNAHTPQLGAAATSTTLPAAEIQRLKLIKAPEAEIPQGGIAPMPNTRAINHPADTIGWEVWTTATGWATSYINHLFPDLDINSGQTKYPVLRREDSEKTEYKIEDFLNVFDLYFYFMKDDPMTIVFPGHWTDYKLPSAGDDPYYTNHYFYPRTGKYLNFKKKWNLSLFFTMYKSNLEEEIPLYGYECPVAIVFDEFCKDPQITFTDTFKRLTNESNSVNNRMCYTHDETFTISNPDSLVRSIRYTIAPSTVPYSDLLAMLHENQLESCMTHTVPAGQTLNLTLSPSANEPLGEMRMLMIALDDEGDEIKTSSFYWNDLYDDGKWVDNQELAGWGRISMPWLETRLGYPATGFPEYPYYHGEEWPVKIEYHPDKKLYRVISPILANDKLVDYSEEFKWDPDSEFVDVADYKVLRENPTWLLIDAKNLDSVRVIDTPMEVTPWNNCYNPWYTSTNKVSPESIADKVLRSYVYYGFGQSFVLKFPGYEDDYNLMWNIQPNADGVDYEILLGADVDRVNFIPGKVSWDEAVNSDVKDIHYPIARYYTKDEGRVISLSLVKDVKYTVVPMSGTKHVGAIYYIDGENVQASVGGIEAEDCAPTEYYDLQGIRVANPTNGLYIKRQGDKVEKVFIAR